MGGADDAFVAKLGATGGWLVHSTYLGGSWYDRGNAIAVDSTGYAYVTGGTYSVNFPVSNALQAQKRGTQDAFAAKLNTYGATLLYSTYLGGSGTAPGLSEEGFGIAVDGSGAAYVTGTTNSTDFPTASAIQPVLAGGSDAFVAKLNVAGGALVYSTYLGGTGLDVGRSIAVDGLGRAAAAGYTSSPDFRSTGPTQAAIGGSYDAFVAKLEASGATLSYS